MALWGKTDNLAGMPKWLTRKNTFDSTSASVVNVTANTIAIPGHRYKTGYPVLYTAADTAIGGLTTATLYYVIRVDADTIKLATTLVNAKAGTAIDITALGDVAGDTLQIRPANLYFVDVTELSVAENKARGFSAPGWWSYDSYTDAGGNTRNKAVCLVELAVNATTSGDASDDAVLADS